MSKQTEVQVMRVGYIVLILSLCLLFVSPFLMPIILAATIALAIYPLQAKLESRNWKTNRAALFLTACFTLIISIPFTFFMAKGTLLVMEQLERFHEGSVQSVVKTIRHDFLSNVYKYADKLPFSSFLSEAKLNTYMQSGSAYLLGFFQQLAMSVPAALLFLIIMILCIHAFLSYAAGVRHFFQSIFGFSDKKMDQLIGIFLRDAREVYVSNIVTGAIQSVIVATAVTFVIGSDWFLLFFVTLIFSFVPVVGAAPMAFLFSAVAFFQDNVTGAIVLVVVGTFSGLIDNILRPWLASFGESKAPGIVSFISVIGGALVLGFPGLFIGLLVGSIAYDTLPLFWDELGKPDMKKSLSDVFSFGGVRSKGKEEEEDSKPQ